MKVYPFASVRKGKILNIGSKVTREKELEKIVQSAMLVPLTFKALLYLNM